MAFARIMAIYSMALIKVGFQKSKVGFHDGEKVGSDKGVDALQVQLGPGRHTYSAIVFDGGGLTLMVVQNSPKRGEGAASTNIRPQEKSALVRQNRVEMSKSHLAGEYTQPTRKYYAP
eukprot:scaffold12111_cov31-Tisochrysis_lutea.AAC.1